MKHGLQTALCGVQKDNGLCFDKALLQREPSFHMHICVAIRAAVCSPFWLCMS